MIKHLNEKLTIIQENDSNEVKFYIIAKMKETEQLITKVIIWKDHNTREIGGAAVTAYKKVNETDLYYGRLGIVQSGTKANVYVDCTDDNGEIINLENCTSETYLNRIVSFINGYDDLAKNSNVQYGLKEILDPLNISIKGMLNHWIESIPSILKIYNNDKQIATDEFNLKINKFNMEMNELDKEMNILNGLLSKSKVIQK